MRRAIERAWKREGIDGRAIRLALLPASALFSAVVRLRALAYRWRLRRRRALPAAVVSVGNLSVGGTGKTPTALWLAETLQKRGYSVAILSRGYGGRVRQPTVVGRASRAGIPASADVRVVGDENVLLARRFSGPVVVARRRAEAGALACRELGANVLVLDDGFQHLALHRDFDLVCVRPSVDGDDCVLPAGRLREPPAALARAHAILVSKGGPEERVPPTLEAYLAKVPSYRGELRAVTLVTPDSGEWRELPMGILAARKALGVAGLADPRPFYHTLHDWEARIQDYLEFADHHVYTLEDWKQISSRSRDLDLVVTTEKDLVKLEQFPFAKDKLVAVRVSMHVENGAQLVDSIVAAVERRRAELVSDHETRRP
ncbi:MAG TPA: tetraacyldisaccharide 4'-kinase [Candidatus Binatia bacterium]|nr:tetraacyldisaccharide 4'-kinase [Candidatus Binatia bacterium]